MKLKSLTILGILCSTALLAACGPSHPSHANQAEVTRNANGQALVKDSEGHRLRKGDGVMLAKLGYGCQSRNTLARAIEEQNLGKMQELQRTIGNYPECITQSEFPGQHWTVTAVHPPLVQIGIVNPEDVRNFNKAASIFAKSGATYYKARYWIPPQWLLKLNPQ